MILITIALKMKSLMQYITANINTAIK